MQKHHGMTLNIQKNNKNAARRLSSGIANLKRLPKSAQKIAPRLSKPRGLSSTHLYSFTSHQLQPDSGIYVASCGPSTPTPLVKRTARLLHGRREAATVPAHPCNRFTTSLAARQPKQTTLNASSVPLPYTSCRTPLKAPGRLLSGRPGHPSAPANVFRQNLCRLLR